MKEIAIQPIFKNVKSSSALLNYVEKKLKNVLEDVDTITSAQFTFSCDRFTHKVRLRILEKKKSSFVRVHQRTWMIQ